MVNNRGVKRSSDSNDANKKKKRRLTTGNSRRSYSTQTYDIEKVVQLRADITKQNKIELKCLVKWEGYSDQNNTWEFCLDYESLRKNEVFTSYIDTEFEKHQDDIYVKIANIKERVKNRICKTLNQNLKYVTMLEAQPFDPFEYKVFQVFYHLTEEKPKLTEYMEELVFKQYFFKLEQLQRIKHDALIDNVAKKDPSIKLIIENDVDFEDPPQFEYIAKNFLVDDVNTTILESPRKTNLKGCECPNGECNKTSNCCPQIMKEPFAYKAERGRTALKLSSMGKIFECNPNCACNSTCINRLSQQERSISLCLFKTEKSGWGVKAMEDIKKGTFVLEYCGELLGHAEAGKRENSDYLFDLNMDRQEDGFYTIDAYKSGSLARFVNHACEPNCMIYFINDISQQPRNQKLCIFTEKDIKKFEEITIDYSPRDIMQITDRINQSHPYRIECHCGSTNCRGSIY